MEVSLVVGVGFRWLRVDTTCSMLRNRCSLFDAALTESESSGAPCNYRAKPTRIVCTVGNFQGYRRHRVFELPRGTRALEAVQIVNVGIISTLGIFGRTTQAVHVSSYAGT